MRRQDEISWMRMPAAVSIPALVLSGGLPIAVRAIQSEFKKLRKIADMSWNPWYPVYTLDRPDSGMLAVAVDPQTLLRMDGLSEKTSEISAVSCDLWWFLDLKEGYQLRRKLFHELVKNRSIDEWRMERRFERLQGYFGIPQSIRSGSPFRTKLEQSNAFVMPAKKWETFVNAMPLNAELDSHRYASTTARSFDLLPDFFLRLEKIESFVCLEENAINMEMNWKIPLSSYRVEEVTPKETIESQNVPVDNAPLDFDLE
jgi:hypothetical protein